MNHAMPLRFSPSVEQTSPGEDATTASINRSMHSILDTTWDTYSHPVRCVHGKSHGIVEGELEVLDHLPAELAQGMFAEAATYPVVMRFSTNPGDILDDTVSSPRGLAMKVIGVKGARLPGSGGDLTQDFLMVNGPAFSAPDAKGFDKNLKMLAATTDTGQGWKRAISAVFRGAVSAMSSVGMEGGALKGLGGQPCTHPLGETFYSQVPFRYGDYVAKFAVAPVSRDLRMLKDAPVDLSGKPNGLRASLIDYFGAHGGEWELRVQLRTNAETMPIEDASVPWPEHESAYVPVARITTKPQPSWNEARAEAVDDALSFSPWHGLEAHQPLGNVNRARRSSYQMAAEFRGAHNGCPMHEPREALALSTDQASVYGRKPGREGHRPGTPDALPGVIGQPLNRTARKLVAGAVGGLAAGVVVSGLLVAMERGQDEPSDLVKLKRRTSKRIGLNDKHDRADADAGEQTVAHGGHLLLSALAGLAYGAAKPPAASPIVSGAVFGAAFYGAAYGAVGPALGVSPPLHRDTRSSIVQHGLIHLLFGVATALVADRAAKHI